MRVGIIGAGAAGMMCAATLQEANPEVEIFLLDRNDGLGKKVIISGGGRCNVTTGIHDVQMVLAKYPRGSKFLIRAMLNFPPQAVFAWFVEHGVPLKTEDDLRVFPESNNGKDVVGVFERLFAAGKTRLLLKSSVVKIDKQGDVFALHIKDQPTPLMVDKLVLTTGGQAYRQTGSTGDGYAFAMSLGHTVTALAPSLNAFYTKQTWPAKISGLSFKKATITARRDRTPHFTGPFLFTHKGVSGPAVFALSSLVAFEKYDATLPLDITIDIFPDETSEALRGRFELLMADKQNKQFSNVLGLLVPKSLAEVVVSELEISETKRVNQVAKKEINKVIDWLKAIPLSVIARGAGDEFVTAGGVELSEIDPKTLSSKICPGLYFAGEVMDVDGFTGGFNLQASWAAGRLAGQSLADEILHSRTSNEG
ncbi:MAG: aminoacetone oxidase family FAD-binding enzyme [Patescibacteria group bacterium]